MKKLLVLALTLSTVFLLSACGSEDGAIKFGVIGPLTGDYSMYGIAVENGAKLAAAELNADGGVLGKTLEIIAYDSKGDATEGVNAYNRLRDQDEVDALIGGTFSGVTMAVKTLAVADGLPVLTPTATNLLPFQEILLQDVKIVLALFEGIQILPSILEAITLPVFVTGTPTATKIFPLYIILLTLLNIVEAFVELVKIVLLPVSYTHLTLPTNREV